MNAPKKTFKDYEPGFVHVDIKYLPQKADESSRRYLFVAIDRATRWVFLPQRAINGKTSIQALKDWQQRRPELFVKRVYDRAGLDSKQISGSILVSRGGSIPVSAKAQRSVVFSILRM